MNTSKKTKWVCVIYLILWVCLLCSCRERKERDQGKEPEIDVYIAPQSIPFDRYIAWRMNDETGWYFQFIEEVMKDGKTPPTYLFQGLNLRYRYSDDYWTINYMQNQNKDGTFTYYRLKSKSGALRFDEGGASQLSDRAVIDEFFSSSTSSLELLRKAKDERDKYFFITIDKDLFFDLVEEGLSSPACEPGTSMLYWGKPSYAIEVEPEYVDGYKFQVCFVMRTGKIGELYIDILYQTGDLYNDYIQLSDLIDSGKADEKQCDAFEYLQKIRCEVKRQSSFLALAQQYNEMTIGKIDFSRLYSFLRAIHYNEDLVYNNRNENPPLITEEISKDEFDAVESQQKSGKESGGS